MTALDIGSPRALAAGAARPVVLGDVVHHAVLRDIERLERVLAEPVTAVRRAALIRHTEFLLDQLQAQFVLLDNQFRTAAGSADPELANRCEEARRSRDELAGVEYTLRGRLARWRTVPGERAAVRTALFEFAAAVRPVLNEDAELVSVLSTVALPGGGIIGVRAARMVPTKRAHQLFWLLDDLDPALAARLLEGTRSSTLWVLRNGFSGAYNRSAYLMWTGGGTGPAV